MHLNQAVKGSNGAIRIKALYWLSKYYLKKGELEEADRTIQKVREAESAPFKSSEELKRELNEMIKLGE